VRLANPSSESSALRIKAAWMKSAMPYVMNETRRDWMRP
jgi:hypothetical protein